MAKFLVEKKLYTKAGNLMIWRRWPVFLTDYRRMVSRFQIFTAKIMTQIQIDSFKMSENLFFKNGTVVKRSEFKISPKTEMAFSQILAIR